MFQIDSSPLPSDAPRPSVKPTGTGSGAFLAVLDDVRQRFSGADMDSVSASSTGDTATDAAFGEPDAAEVEHIVDADADIMDEDAIAGAANPANAEDPDQTQGIERPTLAASDPGDTISPDLEDGGVVQPNEGVISTLAPAIGQFAPEMRASSDNPPAKGAPVGQADGQAQDSSIRFAPNRLVDASVGGSGQEPGEAIARSGFHQSVPGHTLETAGDKAPLLSTALAGRAGAGRNVPAPNIPGNAISEFQPTARLGDGGLTQPDSGNQLGVDRSGRTGDAGANIATDAKATVADVRRDLTASSSVPPPPADGQQYSPIPGSWQVYPSRSREPNDSFVSARIPAQTGHDAATAGARIWRGGQDLQSGVVAATGSDHIPEADSFRVARTGLETDKASEIVARVRPESTPSAALTPTTQVFSTMASTLPLGADAAPADGVLGLGSGADAKDLPLAGTSALPSGGVSNARSAPVHLPQAIQIAESVRGQSGGTIEVSLSPEELGSVRIALHRGEGGLQVAIFAERDDTLALLRRHSDALDLAFRDLDLGHVDISFSQDGSGQDERQNEPGAFTSPDEMDLAEPDPRTSDHTRQAVGQSGQRLDLKL